MISFAFITVDKTGRMIDWAMEISDHEDMTRRVIEKHVRKHVERALKYMAKITRCIPKLNGGYNLVDTEEYKEVVEQFTAADENSVLRRTNKACAMVAHPYQDLHLGPMQFTEGHKQFINKNREMLHIMWKGA